MLQTRLAEDERERFLHEARIIARFVHPHTRADGVLIAECDDMLTRHDAYVRANLEDLPEWVWTD